MKIALCGPPRSGKSVLRERLKTALRRLDLTVYPYILTTNPDGEGAWYQEAYHHDAQAAQRMKVEAKRKWSPEHADLYVSWVRNCRAPLTFLDLGGIVDDYNRRICATATHTILIAPEESALVPWREFSEESGLQVLAELISDYHGTEDHIHSEAPFRATVHRLERGELATPRPAVEALAKHILARILV